VIAQTIIRCVEVLSALIPDYQLVVVDDGSQDRTGSIADAMAAANPRITVVHNSPNRGYGGALLAGFAAAEQPLTFFMDADGQFDIRDLELLLPLAAEGYQVICGYRQHRQDPWPRLVNAWCWNTLVSLLFGLRVRDIDCAFKLMHTDVVRACAIHSEGAVVNTELLVKLKRMGLSLVQVPVRHFPRQHGAATGANLRVVTRAFVELLCLREELKTWDPQQSS
jgi:glycosyltransferase involved in cell wall biosynthesis